MSLAYLAATFAMKDQEQHAREIVGNLLAIERKFKFDPALISNKKFEALVRQVERQQELENLISITVQTNPSGGKVYLNGNYKGYAPLTIERVASGRHLLKIERPGYVTYGQIIETGADDGYLACASH